MPSSRTRFFAFVAAVAVGVAGCGTTTIIASEPSARIFVDGGVAGRGRAEITKRGVPGSSTVVVKTDDGRSEHVTINRRFTLTSFGLGLVTGYVCFVACWEYPETVFVPLAPAGGAKVSWAAGGPDPWLQPPAGWTPRDGSTAIAPPVVPAADADGWMTPPPPRR